MSIRLYPAQTEEGLIYARMLELELEAIGLPILAPEAKDGLTLAVLDSAHPAISELIAAMKEAEIPCLVYGTDALPPASVMPMDYYHRPFSVDEFARRCSKYFSHASAASDIGQHSLLLGSRPKEASFRGQVLGLTGKEYYVLACLYEHMGETVSRETLYHAAWGDGDVRESNVVDVCMRNLRKKLDERFGLRLITAVRGQGYRLLLGEQEDGV